MGMDRELTAYAHLDTLMIQANDKPYQYIQLPFKSEKVLEI